MFRCRTILLTYAEKGLRWFKRRWFCCIVLTGMFLLLPKLNLKNDSHHIHTGTTRPHNADLLTSKPTDLPTQSEELPLILKWVSSTLNIEDNITCKSLSCHVTSNRDVRHHHQLMAIHFHGVSFGHIGFPLPRKPGHIWSLLQEESPKMNFCQFCGYGAMNLFNLTSTFKRESHYPIPTMWLQDERDLLSMEYVVPVHEKNRFRREGLAPVVFVHSDCHNPSDREHYMRLLQQYIKIDSYGKCEHNKNFPMRNMSGMSLSDYTSADFFRLLGKYKFVFAMENTICDDYITEKFWRSFHLGIVPIVFGSPKIKDFAPSDHSIIDIRDFRSVKEVAGHITFLDTNDDEYSKYIDFKQTGVTNEKLRTELDERDWGSGKTFSSFYNGFDCFICEKLHKLKKQMFSGRRVEHWQGKHEHYSCPKPKSFDEEGRYVSESSLTHMYTFAEYYLQAIRYHIDRNLEKNLTEIITLAFNLQNGNKSKKSVA